MSKIFRYTFSTYNRKQILVDYIANDLLEIFQSICREKRFVLVRQSILIEHVHLLINKQNNDSNEYVMKMIKGISARRIFEKYPSNRLESRKLWSRGYRAYEIENENDLRNVISYIDGQKIAGIDKRIGRIGNRDVQSQVFRKA